MNGGQLHFCNENDGDDDVDDDDVDDDDLGGDDNDDDENDGWWTFAFVHLCQRQWPKLHKPHFSPFTPAPT